GGHKPRPLQVPLRTRGGCSYGSGLGCGSVVGAPPTVRTGQTQIFAPCSPPSHPGRVLLRVGGGIGSVVGAPPRCEPGRHKSSPRAAPLRTRGGCSYGSEVGLVM